MTAQTISHTEL